MGSNPINLGLRFVLEMSALVAMGFWGSKQATGPLRWVLAIGIPVIAASIWGTFAVPDDPSRSAKALVAVPGALRLALELAYFSLGILALHSVGARTASYGLAILTVLHYALSYDRLQWLIRQ